MARQVLLVTGSRALANRADSTRWAYGILNTEIIILPDDSIVVSGSARGPDEWSLELAMLHGRTHVQYNSFGERVTSGLCEKLERWIDRAPPASDADRSEWKAWFLLRDRRMVDDLADAHRSGRINVQALALVAPWSRTQGTQYTVTYAKSKGLPIDVKEATDSELSVAGP